MSTSSPITISKGSGGGIISRSSSSSGIRIPGTFSSTVRYGEQVISTGVPSLDSFIGGGIPLGCLCLIKDVFPSRYADCVLKSFIAEGACYNHNIFVASDKEDCEEYLVNELPSLVTSLKKSQHESTATTNSGIGDMKIAWRYGHQHQQGTTSSGNAGGIKELTKFDFSKKSSAFDLGAKHVNISQVLQKDESLDNVDYRDLLQEIFTVLQNFKLPSSIVSSTATTTTSNTNNTAAGTGVQEKFPSNLVRIGLSHCEEQILSPKFMMGLRAMLRHTNSCALLTISDMAGGGGGRGGCSKQSISRCEHFADYVISLQAVTDEKRRTDLGDIDGICDIIKIGSINSLKPVDLPRDLGFSFKRKRLVFHELNLPPEGESTAQREVSNNRPSASTALSSCGTTIKGKSIDF